MKPQFKGQLYPGNDLKLELPDGSTVEAYMEADEHQIIPWKEFDLYGVVSEWRDVESKTPGERILHRDRSSALFYDVPATMEKQKTVWGEAVPREGETQRQANARVIEEDFQNLRAFCEDRWGYYGVILKHTTSDGYEKDNIAALWGIEYGDDCDDAYPTTVANDLLAESGLAAQTCEHDADEDCMNCTECGKCSESLDCQEYCRECGGHECEIAHPGIDEATDEECAKCEECQHVAHYAGRCWADPDCFCEHGRAA